MGHVNMPNVRPPDDPLTLIAKGLGIAKDIFGIKTDVTRLRKYEEEEARRKKASEGVYDEPGIAELQKTHRISEEKPDSGFYQEIRRAKFPDSPLYSSILPKQQEESPLLKVVTNRNGEKWEDYYDKKLFSKGGDAKKALVQSIKLGKSEKGELNPKDIATAAQRAGNQIVSDTKVYRGIEDASKRVNNLTELAKTNPTAAATVITQIARASGDTGVLSDKDLARFGGSQAINARLNRIASVASTGLVPPEDLDFIKGIADVMGKGARESIDSVINDSVSRFTENYGGTFEANYKKLTGMNFKPKEEKSLPEKPPIAPQDEQSIEFVKNNPNHPAVPELLEILKAKGLL